MGAVSVVRVVLSNQVEKPVEGSKAKEPPSVIRPPWAPRAFRSSAMPRSEAGLSITSASLRTDCATRTAASARRSSGSASVFARKSMRARWSDEAFAAIQTRSGERSIRRSTMSSETSTPLVAFFRMRRRSAGIAAVAVSPTVTSIRSRSAA